MRITRPILTKIAQDRVSQRTGTGRDVVAAYLHGILITERDPVLAGTADIDVVLIHEYEPAQTREVVRLTDDVHLDIIHHPRERYRNAKALRLHPVLGPALYDCQILYDPRHVLDFIQASVRAQFYHPDTVLGRVRPRLEAARKTWFDHQFGVNEPGVDELTKYLQAVQNVANAVACLSGDPLSERRFLLDFPERAEAVGQPGLFPGLLGLLGAAEVDAATSRAWLPAWEEAYRAVGDLDDDPGRLHPFRFPYYQRALAYMLDSEQPFAALWPLLNTWLDAIRLLPESHKARRRWQGAFTQLGMLGDSFNVRVEALDVYLDQVEVVVENWAQEQGVSY